MTRSTHNLVTNHQSRAALDEINEEREIEL